MCDESREFVFVDRQYATVRRIDLSVFEKGNIVGLCDMGVMPEYMPGYQDMAEVRDFLKKPGRQGYLLAGAKQPQKSREDWKQGN